MIIVNDSCTEGLVRLVDGRTPDEGVVEICLDGVWGRIISSGWEVPDAEVVCRQLGLPWNCKITLASYVYENDGHPLQINQI